MKEYWLPVMLFIIIGIVIYSESISGYKVRKQQDKVFAQYLAAEPVDTVWRGWNKYEIPTYSDSGKLIWYGHELIANTSYYLGPKGVVAQMSNGMNCQNCHLDRGTIQFGNNFGKVYATYPQFRARNNGMQSIYDQVNDCFERSLNGTKMDTATHEMQAIYAYIKWMGDGVPKGNAEGGTSIMKLKYLDRAANPVLGSEIYIAKCRSCHGDKGEG